VKTKQIIALLKEEDPTGETHVRFKGGELIGFERKPGYYDGAYIYRNDDGKMVLTDKGEKIDVLCEDIKDIIWEHEGNLEDIKTEIIVDMAGESDFWKKVVEPEAEKARRCHAASLAEFTYHILEKVIKEKWEIMQPLDTKIGHYNKMWFEKDGKRERLRQGDCGAVLKSEFFKAVKDDNRKCYVWVLKSLSQEKDE
jgi:hypothetical protein